MIPYELIVCSASRPHLLDETLRTLFQHLEQRPARVLLHDDAVFSGKQEEIGEVLAARVPREIPVISLMDNPPICHGPSLQRLLARVSTEYVLYSQDDHKAVRDIPVAPALHLLAAHGLNQIRFNKRDTMDKKGPEGREFHKVEQRFEISRRDAGRITGTASPGWRATDIRLQTLCVADHWYFQTGVWRVAAIKPVTDWWAGPGSQHGAFSEHMEVKINQVFNGQWRHLHGDLGPTVPVLQSDDGVWNDPETRARVQKTFIWGPIGEPAFVQHVGTDPKDWALIRGNRDLPESKPA